MSDQLCTTAQVKVRLGITDATDDSMISEMIDEVSGWIEGYTGRSFVPETAVTYQFDTTGGYSVRIPRGIRSVTAAGYSKTSQPDTGGTYTAIASPTTNLLFRPSTVDLPIGWPATEVILLPSTGISFATVFNGLTLTGNFGFAATPVDMQGVAIDAVVAAYQAHGNGASAVIGADASAIAPWNQYFGHGSPQRKILDSYRYWRLA
jgi:hypothetical protein